MKTLFIGPYAHNLGSHNSLACWRIVRWICRNIEECEFIQYGDFSSIDCHRNVSNIVYFYSSFYAKFDEIINLMQKHPNANLFWLYNEYTLALNSSVMHFFKDREFSVITNLAEGHGKELTDNAKKIHVINANVTAYRDDVYDRKFNDRPFDLVYYGSFRPNRQKYVKEYFENAYISTTEKNEKLYEAGGLNTNKYIGILRWVNKDILETKKTVVGSQAQTLKNRLSLDMFKYSVYIEDEHIHKDRYNHLSDRFYECLSHGVVLFFDINCKNNVLQSNYEIPDFFFVSNKQELQEKMETVNNNPSVGYDYIHNLKKGIDAEKEQLRNQVRTILSKS